MPWANPVTGGCRVPAVGKGRVGETRGPWVDRSPGVPRVGWEPTEEPIGEPEARSDTGGRRKKTRDWNKNILATPGGYPY
jgi:hypothetical protein